jgi:hypothetical protein
MIVHRFLNYGIVSLSRSLEVEMARYDEFDFILNPKPCLYETECPFHQAQGEVINLTEHKKPCKNCSITFGRTIHTPPPGFVRTNDIPQE